MTPPFDYVPAGVPTPAPTPDPAPYLPRVYVVPAVIALNVIMFLVVGLTGGGWMSPKPETMLRWGADAWPYTTAGEWWRLLTSAFLHFGAIHLFANMYALVSVGPLCERLFGSAFFGLLYFLSAILSGLASVWWDSHAISAGASGAVFAVFGALIAYVSIHRSAFPRGMARHVLQSAGVMVAFNVFYGLSHKGISNSAHLGGLASGLILGAVMARPLFPDRRRAQTRLRAALGIGLGVAAVAVTVAVMPKSGGSGADLRAERAFDDARPAVIAQQDQAIATLERIEAQAKRERWDDAKQAAAIEAQVLPAWDEMLKRLTAAEVSPQSSSRELFELMLGYVKSRRDAYAARAEALRTGNADADQRHQALLKQSGNFAAKINALSNP